MISLEQIHHLQEKVQTAVSRIKTLTAENATLKERLESYEERIAELQTLVTAFKADQEEIEAGIVAALSHLDQLEDAVATERPADSAESAAPPDHGTRARTEDDSPTSAAQAVDASEPASEAAPESVPASEPSHEPEPAERAPDPTQTASSPTDEGEEEDEEPELDIF